MLRRKLTSQHRPAARRAWWPGGGSDDRRRRRVELPGLMVAGSFPRPGVDGITFVECWAPLAVSVAMGLAVLLLVAASGAAASDSVRLLPRHGIPAASRMKQTMVTQGLWLQPRRLMAGGAWWLGGDSGGSRRRRPGVVVAGGCLSTLEPQYSDSCEACMYVTDSSLICVYPLHPPPPHPHHHHRLLSSAALQGALPLMTLRVAWRWLTALMERCCVIQPLSLSGRANHCPPCS